MAQIRSFEKYNQRELSLLSISFHGSNGGGTLFPKRFFIMRWTSRNLQLNFYSQTIYKEVVGFYKKSIAIYRIRINPPRNMVEVLFTKQRLFYFINENNSKENVRNVLNFIRKDNNTLCLVSTVIIEHTHKVAVTDMRYFAMCKLSRSLVHKKNFRLT